MTRASATPEAMIVDAIATFLRRKRLMRVHFAENGATTPQSLAYFVHFPRLYVALNGEDAMWFEQGGEARLVRVVGGEAVVVPANCWNRPASSQPSAALNVLFGRRQIGLSLVARDVNGHTPVVKTTLPAAREEAPRSIMHALLAVRSGTHAAELPLVEALLRSIIQALTATGPGTQRRAVNLYESICMYVQEHFQSALTRDSVAAHFRISPNHVSRLFKHEGMVSFNQYVTYVRLNSAKHLLRNHHQSIDEIASLCGYTETSYFCRVFKRKTELTPSAYRHARAP